MPQVPQVEVQSQDMEEGPPNKAMLPRREKALAYTPAQRALSLPLKTPPSPSSIFRSCFSFLATSFRKSLEFRWPILGGERLLPVQVWVLGAVDGASAVRRYHRGARPTSPCPMGLTLPRCVPLRARNHPLTCPLGFSQTWCSREREKVVSGKGSMGEGKTRTALSSLSPGRAALGYSVAGWWRDSAGVCFFRRRANIY